MYTLQLKDARFEIGTWVYFQWEPDKISKAVLIGIRPEKYIATTQPVPYLSNDVNDVTVYFHDGINVYEFKTKVLKFIDDPIQFLLLEYPESLSLREQRKYKRIRCFVSAKINYSAQNRCDTVEGIIKDISKKGCKITFTTKGVEGEQFSENERIAIVCKFPGIPGEQEIMGIIRNVTKGKGDLSLGIEFEEFAWWAPPY